MEEQYALLSVEPSLQPWDCPCSVSYSCTSSIWSLLFSALYLTLVGSVYEWGDIAFVCLCLISFNIVFTFVFFYVYGCFACKCVCSPCWSKGLILFIAQACLELIFDLKPGRIVLQSLKCWQSRCQPPCPANTCMTSLLSFSLIWISLLYSHCNESLLLMDTWIVTLFLTNCWYLSSCCSQKIPNGHGSTGRLPRLHSDFPDFLRICLKKINKNKWKV